MFLDLGDPGSWIEWLVNRTINSTHVDLKVIYLPSNYLTFQSLFFTRRDHRRYHKYYFKFNSGINSLTFLLVGNRLRLMLLNEQQIVSDQRSWSLTTYETRKTGTSLESLCFSPSSFHFPFSFHSPAFPEAWLSPELVFPKSLQSLSEEKWQVSKWRGLVTRQLTPKTICSSWCNFKELNRLFIYPHI